MIKVLHWKDDPAATNITEHLRELGLGESLIESENSLLFSEEPAVEADFFIVASTHKSESNISSLSVHPSGNFGTAKLGGNDKELSFTVPKALKLGLQSLDRLKLEGFEVTMEATHHGPTSWKTPLIFIEIGSTETEWKNKKAGEVVATAIKDIVESEDEFKNCIGFGGTHYCSSFNSIQLNTEFAIGHMAPKHVSGFLDKEIVEQMLKKSFAEKALIDWKGVKSETRNKVIKALDELGVEWKKTKNV